MIRTAISWYSAGPIITASDNVDSSGEQVHPVVQRLLTNNDAVLQDDCSPKHTARSVLSRFEQHGDARQHLPWPTQLLALNIIEPLWSVSESKFRSRFLPPSPVKQLQDVLHEERHSTCIALGTVQNLCESTARRTQTVLQANGGLTAC
jgi:hypothetical protein